MKTLCKNLILSLAGLLALAAQPGFAQDAMSRQIAVRFAAADEDHDGKLTKAEAHAGMPRIAQVFDQIDVDHHGYITLAQIAAFAARHQH